MKGIINFVVFLLTLLIGLYIIYFAELDDSPGLGGIGIFIIVLSFYRIYKFLRK